MECSAPPPDGGDRSSKFRVGLVANVPTGSAAPPAGGAQELVDALNRLRPGCFALSDVPAVLSFLAGIGDSRQ
eukprot:COSAG05_NODE_2459_length_3037_cov_3.928523_1_plen_72_part_10